MIAHEVGHHVQNLLGISERVRSQQERGSEALANALSVRLELQADCYCRNLGKSRGPGRAISSRPAMSRKHWVPPQRWAMTRSSGVRRGKSFLTLSPMGPQSSGRTGFGPALQSGELESCDTFARGG